MECPFLLPLFFKVTLSPNFNSFLDRRIQEKEQKERMPRDFFSSGSGNGRMQPQSIFPSQYGCGDMFCPFSPLFTSVRSASAKFFFWSSPIRRRKL